MPGIPRPRSLPLPHPANYRGPTRDSDRSAAEEAHPSRPAVGRGLDRNFFGGRIDARLRPGAFHLGADALRRKHRLFAASASASGAAAMGAAAECINTPADTRPDIETDGISIPLPRHYPFSDPVQLLLDLKAVHQWLKDFFAKSELERKRDKDLKPRRQALVTALTTHVAHARKILEQHPGHGTDKINVARDGTDGVRDADEVDLGRGLLSIVSHYLDDIRSADVEKIHPLWLHEEIRQFIDYVSDQSPALTLAVWLREAEAGGNTSPFLARLRMVSGQGPESSGQLLKVVKLAQQEVPEDRLLILLRLIELQAEDIDPLLVKEAVLARPRSESNLGPKRLRKAEELYGQMKLTEAAEAYSQAGDWFIGNGFEFLARKAWLAEAEGREAAGDSVAADQAGQKARQGERGLISEIDSLIQQALGEFGAGKWDDAYAHARIAAARSRLIQYSGGLESAEALQNTIRSAQGRELREQAPKSRERFEQTEALSLDHVAALIQQIYRRPVTGAALERAIRAMMPGRSRAALFRDIAWRAFKITESQLTEGNQVVLTIMHEFTRDKIWTAEAMVGFVPGGIGKADVLQLIKLENPDRRRRPKWEGPWDR